MQFNEADMHTTKGFCLMASRVLFSGDCPRDITSLPIFKSKLIIFMYLFTKITD